MQTSAMEQLRVWLKSNVEGRINKEHLLERAQTSGLPREVLMAMGDIPEGDHDRNSIESLVYEKLVGEPEMSMGAGLEVPHGRDYEGP